LGLSIVDPGDIFGVEDVTLVDTDKVFGKALFKGFEGLEGTDGTSVP
jgi:hypothetical protein